MKENIVLKKLVVICLFISGYTQAQNVMGSKIITQHDIPFMQADDEDSSLARYDYADRQWDCGLVREIERIQWFGEDEVVMILKCKERNQPENPKGYSLDFMATFTSTASGLQLTEWVDGGSARSNYVMTCGIYSYDASLTNPWPEIFEKMNYTIHGREVDGIGRRDSYDILPWAEDEIGFRLIEERDTTVVRKADMSAKLIVDCGLESVTDTWDTSEWELNGDMRNAITHVALDPIDEDGNFVDIVESDSGEDGGANRKICTYYPSGRGVSNSKFVCSEGFMNGSSRNISIEPHELNMPWAVSRTEMQHNYEFQCVETGEELRVGAAWIAEVLRKIMNQDLTVIGDVYKLTDMLEEKPDAHLDVNGIYAMGSKRSIFPDSTGHKEFITLVGPIKVETNLNLLDFLPEGYKDQDPISVDVKQQIIEKVLNAELVITSRGCLIAPEDDFDNLAERVLIENSIHQWNYVRGSWGYANVEFSNN